MQEFELFKESKGREIKETVIQFVTIRIDYHLFRRRMVLILKMYGYDFKV